MSEVKWYSAHLHIRALCINPGLLEYLKYHAVYGCFSFYSSHLYLYKHLYLVFTCTYERGIYEGV